MLKLWFTVVVSLVFVSTCVVLALQVCISCCVYGLARNGRVWCSVVTSVGMLLIGKLLLGSGILVAYDLAEVGKRGQSPVSVVLVSP